MSYLLNSKEEALFDDCCKIGKFGLYDSTSPEKECDVPKGLCLCFYDFNSLLIFQILTLKTFAQVRNSRTAVLALMFLYTF